MPPPDVKRTHRSNLVRPELLTVPADVHGSASRAELAAYGLDPADVIDFSVSTNPLGIAPSVLQAVQGTDWGRYPGDDEPALVAALAAQNNVQPDRVILGNGSSELLWLLALATLRPGDTVAVQGPTFGEYARCARVFGAHVVVTGAGTDDITARLLFVCNPNNPTGAYLDGDEVTHLVSANPQRLVIVDEAYRPFVDVPWPSETLLEYDNVVLLRSLTKDHGLPGLRLGYLLAAPEVARAVTAARPPWSVNAGALRAGLAALDPEAQAHLARARAVVQESRALLTAGFTALGYRVWPAAANFVLVEVGDGAAFRQALLPHGLVVRDCASFGLPGCIRVACRLPAQCLRLLETVATMPVTGIGHRGDQDLTSAK